MKSLGNSSRMPADARSRRPVRIRASRAEPQLTTNHVKRPRVAVRSRTREFIQEEAQEVGTARLGGAVVAGAGGLLIVALLGWRAFDLNAIVNTDFKVFLVKFIVRAIGTLALSYLAYTLFSLAERLLLPLSLLRGGRSQVPLIRAVLGVRSPMDATRVIARRGLGLPASQSEVGRPAREEASKEA